MISQQYGYNDEKQIEVSWNIYKSQRFFVHNHHELF